MSYLLAGWVKSAMTSPQPNQPFDEKETALPWSLKKDPLSIGSPMSLCISNPIGILLFAGVALPKTITPNYAKNEVKLKNRKQEGVTVVAKPQCEA